MAKRAHGEGTIRRLPSGRWSWVRMTGYDERGRKMWERVTADTQKELLQAVEAHKQEKAAEASKILIPALNSYAKDWHKRYQSALRVSTQSSYRYTLEKLLNYWGDTPVDQIRPSAVTDMLQHFADRGLSESYIKKLKSMLYQILEEAEADEVISRNPVRYAKWRSKGVEANKDAFTPAEIHSLLLLPPSKQRDFIILCIMTGMRTQEMLALRGTDIAKDGSYIQISRAVNMNGNIPYIGLTKSPSGIRKIPVPTAVRHIASQYCSYGDTLIWESPRYPERTINPSTYRAAFTRLCKAAGVRPLTPHCCRHTYITQLHAHGVDMSTIKALAGHSRRDVTEGYLHIKFDYLAAEVEKLNDLLEGITSDFVG